MHIKLELLKDEIAEYVINRMERLEIDVDKITDTIAIKILAEIQDIIQNDDISDFDAVEQIVCIFEKYKISAGARHDFG